MAASSPKRKQTLSCPIAPQISCAGALAARPCLRCHLCYLMGCGAARRLRVFIGTCYLMDFPPAAHRFAAAIEHGLKTPCRTEGNDDDPSKHCAKSFDQRGVDASGKEVYSSSIERLLELTMVRRAANRRPPSTCSNAAVPCELGPIAVPTYICRNIRPKSEPCQHAKKACDARR